MGNEHEIIAKEKLQKDVLDGIRQNHRLTKCPICGIDLTEMLCSMEKQIPWKLKSYGDRQVKNCKNCRIVWQLEIFNWTNERGDGMVSGTGHQLHLEGRTNCFCRSLVFKHGHVMIEDSEPHHSLLYSPCPNK